MTLDEFIAKWNGKQLEVAGSANAKYQCVDLANGYIRDVLGLPIIEWTDAKDFPSKGGDNYTYVKNTPTGTPPKGAIIVWNANVGGGHGHIAVVISATANAFVSFDQNYSKPLYCTIENHNYNNVAGWMIPKVLPTEPSTITIEKALFEKLVTEGAAYQELKKDYAKQTENYQKVISGLNQEITDLTHANQFLGAELAECKQKPAEVITQPSEPCPEYIELRLFGILTGLYTKKTI